MPHKKRKRFLQQQRRSHQRKRANASPKKKNILTFGEEIKLSLVQLNKKGHNATRKEVETLKAKIKQYLKESDIIVLQLIQKSRETRKKRISKKMLNKAHLLKNQVDAIRKRIKLISDIHIKYEINNAMEEYNKEMNEKLHKKQLLLAIRKSREKYMKGL